LARGRAGLEQSRPHAARPARAPWPTPSGFLGGLHFPTSTRSAAGSTKRGGGQERRFRGHDPSNAQGTRPGAHGTAIACRPSSTDCALISTCKVVVTCSRERSPVGHGDRLLPNGRPARLHADRRFGLKECRQSSPAAAPPWRTNTPPCPPAGAGPRSRARPNLSATHNGGYRRAWHRPSPYRRTKGREARAETPPLRSSARAASDPRRHDPRGVIPGLPWPEGSGYWRGSRARCQIADEYPPYPRKPRLRCGANAPPTFVLRTPPGAP
jgi:hypothetical protein